MWSFNNQIHLQLKLKSFKVPPELSTAFSRSTTSISTILPLKNFPIRAHWQYKNFLDHNLFKNNNYENFNIAVPTFQFKYCSSIFFFNSAIFFSIVQYFLLQSQYFLLSSMQFFILQFLNKNCVF